MGDGISRLPETIAPFRRWGEAASVEQGDVSHADNDPWMPRHRAGSGWADPCGTPRLAGIKLMTAAGMDIRLRCGGKDSDRTSSTVCSPKALLPF